MADENDGKVGFVANPLGQLGAARLDRRELFKRTGLISAAAAAGFVLPNHLNLAAAQTSSGGTTIKSPTRDQVNKDIEEAFPGIRDQRPKGGTVIWGASTDIGTTNVMLAADSPTLPVLGLVFETLVGSHPTKPEYVPGLADSWEISADGFTYTFHLNQQAKWHDGTPFTAADCDFSFSIQANPDTGSSYTGAFNDNVKSWKVIDDHTFEVTAKPLVNGKPPAPVIFFGNAYAPIMPKHLWANVAPKDWAKDPGSTGQDPKRIIGTGPFKFVSWKQGEGVELARNDNYYGDVPHIDTFKFRVWPDDATAVEALRSGDIDIFENVPPADVASLKGQKATDVQIFDTFDFTFYAYNLDPAKTTLFQEREVRQALFYALDRQSMADNIMLGFATPAQGTQPTLSPAYAPDQMTTKYTFDVNKAKQLLDGAGWTVGSDGIRAKNGQQLKFQLMYPSGSATTDQLVAYMQEAWKNIGVAMTPNAVDFGTVLVPTIEKSFDYQVVMLGFIWDITGDQSAMFSTNSYKLGFNMMKYSNPEYDKLANEARVELDDAKRKQLLVQASDIAWTDLPVAIVFFRKNRDGYQTRVKQFHANAYGGLLWTMSYVYL